MKSQFNCKGFAKHNRLECGFLQKEHIMKKQFPQELVSIYFIKGKTLKKGRATSMLRNVIKFVDALLLQLLLASV